MYVIYMYLLYHYFIFKNSLKENYAIYSFLFEHIPHLLHGKINIKFSPEKGKIIKPFQIHSNYIK